MAEISPIQEQVDKIQASLEMYLAFSSALSGLPSYDAICEIYTNEVAGFKNVLKDLEEKYGDSPDWETRKPELKKRIADEREKTVDYFKNDGKDFLKKQYDDLKEAVASITKLIKELVEDAITSLTEAFMPTSIGVAVPNPASLGLKMLLALIRIKKAADALAVATLVVLGLLETLGIIKLIETLTGFNKTKKPGMPSDDWVSEIKNEKIKASVMGVKSFIDKLLKNIKNVQEESAKTIEKGESQLSNLVPDKGIIEEAVKAFGTINPWSQKLMTGAEVLELAESRYGLTIYQLPLSADSRNQLLDRSMSIDKREGEGVDAPWRKLVEDLSAFIAVSIFNAKRNNTTTTSPPSRPPKNGTSGDRVGP